MTVLLDRQTLRGHTVVSVDVYPNAVDNVAYVFERKGEKCGDGIVFWHATLVVSESQAECLAAIPIDMDGVGHHSYVVDGVCIGRSAYFQVDARIQVALVLAHPDALQ